MDSSFGDRECQKCQKLKGSNCNIFSWPFCVRFWPLNSVLPVRMHFSHSLAIHYFLSCFPLFVVRLSSIPGCSGVLALKTLKKPEEKAFWPSWNILRARPTSQKTEHFQLNWGLFCKFPLFWLVGISSARLTRSFFYAWQPPRPPWSGWGLFGKRASPGMASFLVLAEAAAASMASHRAKTSPLYHNEPPTSIEPLRGCSLHINVHSRLCDNESISFKEELSRVLVLCLFKGKI